MTSIVYALYLSAAGMGLAFLPVDDVPYRTLGVSEAVATQYVYRVEDVEYIQSVYPYVGLTNTWYEPAPVDFKYGIAVGSESNDLFYALVVPDDGTAVIPVLAHASPFDPVAFNERKDAELARRQAIRNELNLTEQQIAAIQAYFDADVDALFPTLTANQRQFLKVQRAAVRYLLKQELKEVAP